MEIFQLQAKDTVIRINDSDVVTTLGLPGIQNFSWEPTMNESYKEELGNKGYAGQSTKPEVSGSFDVNASGSTVAFLRRMIKSFSAGGEFEGYLGQDNEGLIRETQLEDAVFDVVVAKKANEEFTRSELLTRMYLSSLSFSASADGDASETFGFAGDIGEIFVDPMHDLVAVPVVRGDEGGANLTTEIFIEGVLADTATDVEATAVWRIHHIQQEDERIDAADLTVLLVDTDADTTMDSTVLTVAGTTLRQGAKLTAVMYRKTPGDFPTINYPTTARFIEADQIDIYLVKKSVTDIEALLDAGTHTLVDNTNNGLTEINLDGQEVLRIQSADINVDLRREALRQIKRTTKGNAIYHRSATYPLSITSSLSAYETDLALWRKIVGAGATDVLDLTGFEDTDNQIVIRYYIDNVCVQAIALLDGAVTGRGSSVGTGGSRATENWSFTGSKLAIEGTVL
jgi:hypothetical protein